MKVSIDQQRCQGHGRCYLLSPDLFEPEDDYGHAMVILAGAATDDSAVEEQLENAARSCPESAVVVE